jgi:Ni/Fe-hydrogenase subunit HybB-like protein
VLERPHHRESFDFATSVIPGWHTTIFPPYFVAGAIFSGFACVMTLLLIARWTLNLQNLITIKHLENMNKIILVTGSIVGYAYACEFFIAWYSGNIYERFTFLNRALGRTGGRPGRCTRATFLSRSLYWFKKMRTNLWVMFVISITTNIGMWFERFVIIATSLTRDFLPTSWGYFHPTWVDMCTLFGTIGLFLTLFLLFARFLPMIAISEVKGVLAYEKELFKGQEAEVAK